MKDTQNLENRNVHTTSASTNSISPKTEVSNSPKQILGVADAIVVIVGIVVGAGIFRTLLVQGAIAVFLIIIGSFARSGFESMVDFTAPIFWFFILCTGLSLFVLRYKEPHAPRPFKVPLYFVQGNLFNFDFSKADVLTLYLLPEVNLKLRPKILKELKPGTRIVSHAFDMGDWEPEKTITFLVPHSIKILKWRLSLFLFLREKKKRNYHPLTAPPLNTFSATATTSSD